MATLAQIPRLRMRSERVFFTSMAILVLVLVFAGFAPSFYLRGLISPDHPMAPLNALVMLHGLVFSAWVILFAVQTGLVASGNVRIHKRLGLLGAGIVALMIPLAVLVALGGTHRAHSGPAGIPPLSWLAVPLVNVPVFAGIVIAALANRRSPAIHKRPMLIAMLSIMGPALGRLPAPPPIRGLFSLVSVLLLLVPLMMWDWRTRGRVHAATLWASIVALIGEILPPMVWHTGWWLAFAGWASTLMA